MEAAQYLWILLTDQYQNFTKWALFGHTLQDSDHGGHPTSIWTYCYKMEAGDFTKWVLFGHTLQDFDRRGHWTSIWTYCYKMEAAQYLCTLLTDQHQNFTKWVLFGRT